jgi:signal transduction histidine kinase
VRGWRPASGFWSDNKTTKKEVEMKRVTIVAMTFLFVISLAGTAMAQSATKDECVAKCKEAANLVNEKGLDAAIAEINKKDGKFVWKDSYVFLMDLDGKMLAHPVSPGLIGKDQTGLTDKAGKPMIKEFVEVAKTKGEGWVPYMWPKPGSETPVKKLTYVYRVPGKNPFTAAGTYE